MEWEALKSNQNLEDIISKNINSRTSEKNIHEIKKSFGKGENVDFNESQSFSNRPVIILPLKKQMLDSTYKFPTENNQSSKLISKQKKDNFVRNTNEYKIIKVNQNNFTNNTKSFKNSSPDYSNLPNNREYTHINEQGQEIRVHKTPTGNFKFKNVVQENSVNNMLPVALKEENDHQDNNLHSIHKKSNIINKDKTISNSNELNDQLKQNVIISTEEYNVLTKEINKDNSELKYQNKNEQGCREKRDTYEKPCAPHLSDYSTKQYIIELMITVDRRVMELHSEDDIEMFIVTIVNMVSSNFYDATMGINMNVALVRLILLTNAIEQLDVDVYTPAEVLEKFCAWQFQINPNKDDHPNHHDLAIFVTRMQTCEGQILGISYMTSLCQADKSCIVCVDEGLLLANIITHQIGHSLGAEHDEGQNKGCPDSEPDGTTYHMGPNIRQTSCEWSICSRESIIQFIKSHGSWCLSDTPSHHKFDFPLILPGQIYSAAQQCRLNFHMYATPCEVGKFCERLFCQISATECVTKGDPPADGTFCAADMWCFKKDCVAIGRRPGAINGEWGSWTKWSQCTRTCGGGVQMSFRLCNNPKPSKGGRYCVGKGLRYKMCAIDPCQGFTQSFRDLQCMKSYERLYRGHYHNWHRFDGYIRNIECSLVCQNRLGEVVLRSLIVVDGTPCKAGTRNVCIKGTCVNVGCDWVIESNAKEDSCGICHGNGTGCRIISGVFDESSKCGTVVPFLNIPAGSGMIFVREINPSNNMIAVSGVIKGVFYLNGVGHHDDATPGDMLFGSTHGTYEIRSNMERIFIRGPTTEPLVFHVVFSDVKSGIRYQYAIPENDPNYTPRYQWQYTDWEQCSSPCSGGAQRCHAKCVEDRGGVVDDVYCMMNTRPNDVIRPCNNFPCHARWWVSVWSECICKGSVCLMFRSVVCMTSRDEDATRAEIIRDSECSDHVKPRSHKPCNESDLNTACVKRSVKSDFPCGSNTSHLNLYPYRSVLPKLYPVKQNDAQETHTLKSESVSETANKSPQSKAPIRERSHFNNQMGNKSQLLFNLVNEIPSRTYNRVKGAADKLQKHMFSNALTNKKQVLMSKGISRYPNKNSEANGTTRINGTGTLQKSKLQINESRNESNTSNIKSNSVQNTFERNATNNEDEESADTENSSTIESNENTHQVKSVLKQVTHSPEDLHDSKMKSPLQSCQTAARRISPVTTSLVTRLPVPHKRTTCRKKLRLTTVKPPKKITTKRPRITKLDQLDLNQYKLTVVPIDPPNRKLPQTDEEYSHFGDTGLYSVGSVSNSSVVFGQDAIDLLERARENATNPPVVQHEEEED